MYRMKPVAIFFICTVPTFYAQFQHFSNIASSTENISEILTSGNFTSTVAPTVPEYLQGKHESLLTCPLMTLKLGEFDLFPNGTLHVETLNISLNQSLYIQQNNTVMICDYIIQHDFVIDYKEEYWRVVGPIISTICLLLHLTAFTFVPDMRNQPGWNLAAMCFSLLCSYILILLLLITSKTIMKSRNICIIIATLTNFFLLSANLWMTVISFDVFVSLLRATESLKSSNTKCKLKKFTLYCICAFGVAMVISLLSTTADVLDAVPISFKPQFEETCWFSNKTSLLIFFGIPVIALTFLNFTIFGLSSYMICSNKFIPQNNCTQTNVRRDYLIYFKLSVVMGVTWIIGTLVMIFNEKLVLSILELLNTLQGVFIFLAFTCSEQVRKPVLQKILRRRRGSKEDLSPKRRTHCFYTNSIETNLNKISN